MIGIVDLSGGFGNHLFQYSFALNLKEQGVRVYLFNQEKKEYFNPKEFDLKKLNVFSIVVIQFLKKFKVFNKHYKVLTSHEILENKLDIQKSFEDKKIISFNGYFQDYESVIENLSFIKKVIHKKIGIKEMNSSRTLLHVRRGDYIDNNENLSLNYYRDALDFCKNNIKGFEYDIFTDDYEWVLKQDVFKDASYIENSKNITKRYENDVWSTFIKMLNYNNYIIANSTFSWWAAIISYDNKSTIIQPEPFFHAFNNAQLKVPEWISFQR